MRELLIKPTLRLRIDHPMFFEFSRRFFGGIFFGLGLGLFFVTLIDDKVKSVFDIEASIGLPLLGIIPKVKIRFCGKIAYCCKHLLIGISLRIFAQCYRI